MKSARDKLNHALTELEEHLLHADAKRAAADQRVWHAALNAARERGESALDTGEFNLRETQEKRVRRLLKGCAALRPDADRRVCEQLGRESLALRISLGVEELDVPTSRVKPMGLGEASDPRRRTSGVTRKVEPKRVARKPAPPAPRAPINPLDEESSTTSKPVQELVFEDFSLERARLKRRRPSNRRPAADEPEWSLLRTREPRAARVPRPGLSWRMVITLSAVLAGIGISLIIVHLATDTSHRSKPSQEGGSQAHAMGESNPANNSSTGDSPKPVQPINKSNNQQGVAVFLVPPPGDGLSDLKSAMTIGSPFHALDTLDARFGDPKGRARMNELLSRMVSTNANWRQEGTLDALLRSLRTNSGLLLYRDKPQLLPSEVIAQEGGDMLPLALTWFMLGRRLGQSVSGFAQPGEDAQELYPLLADGTPFWGSALDFESAPVVDAQAVLMMLTEALLQRELAVEDKAVRADLGDLINLLALTQGEASVEPYRMSFASALLPLAASDKLDSSDSGDGAESYRRAARELLTHLRPNQLSRASLVQALEVLGTEASFAWYARAHEWAPDHVLASSGVPIAELYARSLLREQPVIDGVPEAWRDLFAAEIRRALWLAPQRVEALRQLAIEGNVERAESFIAQARFDLGDVSTDVVRRLAADAISRDQQLKALSLLQTRLLADLPLEDADLPLIYQAIVLALNLELWEAGEALLLRGLNRWQQDPILLKLDAESLIAARRVEEGKRLLERYTRAFPDDIAASERLKAVSGK